MDDGPADGSTGGESQFLVYCSELGVQPLIKPSRTARCHFGIGVQPPNGLQRIRFSMGDLWLEFDIHVVEADVPVLLYIDDIDRLSLYLINLENALLHQESEMKAKNTRIKGHLFIQWNPHVVCMLTTVELRRLYLRFGYLSTDKLMKLLETSEVKNIGPCTRRDLEKIERYCKVCQTYA